jgi:hypothetical protein
VESPRTHFVIPDCQVKPGVPIDHIGWIGEYLVERKPSTVICLGDFADMESLSLYDVGKLSGEGKRYEDDIVCANDAFDLLCSPMERYLESRRKWRKPIVGFDELHFLDGNHEHRITRAVDDDPKYAGKVGLSDLRYEDHGWTRHGFLEPVELDGVWYSHFWANPMSGRPYGGAAAGRLKTIGHSFVMGHQQTLDYAIRFLANGQQQFGLVVGACYLHDEDYKGPQGNAHWRGVVVLHQVEAGAADAMFVSLDFLCRKYEGVSLSKFAARRF